MNTIKNALKEYVKIGKFAPRPAHILEIMATSRGHESAAIPPPDKLESNCPPEIAKAWTWFIAHIAQGSKNMTGLFDDSLDATVDQQERWLHLVNHEAREANQPDAIPEQYRLAEVWGQT